MNRLFPLFTALASFLSLLAPASVQAQTANSSPALATLEYRIVGAALEVSPAVLSVPKGIPGSIAVNIRADSNTAAALATGTYVEAYLRGPSFPSRRLVGAPNQPLLLPPLNLVGDYQLDAIRLVDTDTGATRLEGSPSSVPVRVFDEVLVSRVTSRVLTLEEIQGKGIVIDQSNFRAVEFTVAFVLEGQTIPIKFPVIAPRFDQSTELIPQAELEARLAQADVLNSQLGAVGLPPGLASSGLNFELKGINFQPIASGGNGDLTLRPPPITALLVIPGNIGFLNQFFSVQLFVENAAPSGSGLSVTGLRGELVLPKGEDQVAGTYAAPGDDPVRFARVGPDAAIYNIKAVRQAGPDGIIGTADDVDRLQPAQTAQAEFLVEGLREGLHVLDIKLNGRLEGLAAGAVDITGSAAGSVLVRNPKFSMAFAHPRTVRTGEPYKASITILNTSSVTANLVSVTLAAASISGAELLSDATVELGNIAPGETRTATYQLKARRTGYIRFSNLETGDGLTGRFNLFMGVDERGVALSPDSLGYPDYVNELPLSVFEAAERVLGQALSAATAGQLPPGVLRVSRSTVQRRALDLSEAGQRIRYGDPLARVLPDLLLDFQGARQADAAFDQIVRTTEAGREWRQAVLAAWLASDPNPDGIPGLLDRHAADLAGLGVSTIFATSNQAVLPVSLLSIYGDSATPQSSTLAQSISTQIPEGSFAFGIPSADRTARWDAAASLPAAHISVAVTSGNGQLSQWLFDTPALNTGDYVTFDPSEINPLFRVHRLNGSIEAFAGLFVPVSELPPVLLAARQDLDVLYGRPANFIGGPPGYNNYGQLIAVMFSKPMNAASAALAASYDIDGANGPSYITLQPGGRVALVGLKLPIGTTIGRNVTITGVSDPRGNPLPTTTLGISTTADKGYAVRGRVVRADGSPAANTPVTLTYTEVLSGGYTVDIRAAQQKTDSDGYFLYDHILSNITYTLSATDVSGLSDALVDTIISATSGDQLVRAQLEDLAASDAVKNSLLAEFAVDGLPAAIARAEGLDRALLRDHFSNPALFDTTQTIALRFRGRGTVLGQVTDPNGNPVPAAVVNLFADPASRELGRGLFADAQGRFAFYGVPLGVFSVEAATSSGLRRTVSGSIETNGQIVAADIALSATVPLVTTMTGAVFEADGVTPHAAARIFLGSYFYGNSLQGIVATTTTNSDGLFSLDRLPVGNWIVLAISADGRRKSSKTISLFDGVPAYAQLLLETTATVRGRVEFANGTPAPFAYVAGAPVLAQADATGAFTIENVPVGGRFLSAGVAKNPAAGIDFPRFGNASLSVVPGDANYIVIRLVPAGTLTGRVLDTLGRPQPFTRVVIPVSGGFMWTVTDVNGNYVFEALGLNTYTVSAPGPESALVNTSLSASTNTGENQDVLSAATASNSIFTSATNPLAGNSFSPITWGYNSGRLDYDGQILVRDISYIPVGTVDGQVQNAIGTPVGAIVRLLGIGPSGNGAPTTLIRGEMDSDPATGLFSFPGKLLAGPYTLQAVSPLFPSAIVHNAETTRIAPNAFGILLQFPPTTGTPEATNGHIQGIVLKPDGTPAGADVNVQISFGPDYIIRTIADGTFDATLSLPPGNYTVEAHDPISGLKARTYAYVSAAQTTNVTVRLLGLGDLAVTVLKADGTPAVGADVDLSQGGYPFDRVSGITGPGGIAVFPDLFEGSWSASARFLTGVAQIGASGRATVALGVTTPLTLNLAPVGSIEGRFLARDGVTPISFAQVSVGSIAYAVTNSDGRFSATGLPLGTYRVLATEPVSGRIAIGSFSLNFSGQVASLTLLDRSLGEIKGTVINSTQTGPVAAAHVTLSINDGLGVVRSVTTGPDGGYSFPGVPDAPFSLSATDPVTGLTGYASGNLPPDVASVTVDISLPIRASFRVLALEPDGTTPAVGATVSVGGLVANADTNGYSTFSNLGLGGYTVYVVSNVPGNTRSAGVVTLNLNTPGPNPDVTVLLRGVGRIQGRVLTSLGDTVADAQVSLSSYSTILGTENRTAISGPTGEFSFDNISLGSFALSARSIVLTGNATGFINTNGQVVDQDLTLRASRDLVGRLALQRDLTAVANTDVVAGFEAVGVLGRLVDRSAADGGFRIPGVPVGPATLESVSTSLNGIAFRALSIPAGSGDLDVGDLLLDQDDPELVSSDPLPEAVQIFPNQVVTLTFTEALDPAYLFANAVYLKEKSGPVVPCTLTLLPDATARKVITLTPTAPLKSLTAYEVVILDGDRNTIGFVVAHGVRDLVGRVLPRPYVIPFTTRDTEPPVVLSYTPENNEEQVDTRAVVRLSFNEPIDPATFTLSLTGPTGNVPGDLAIGIGNKVVTFTPTVFLSPNATYTSAASGLRDLAGNLAAGQPLTKTFKTLDTLGPVISQLRVRGGRPLTAGTAIEFEAVLAAPETNPRLTATANFVSLGTSNPGILFLPYTLPASGSVTVRANAYDRFGNQGPLLEQTFTVVANQPPSVVFTRLTPSSGPIATGSSFSILVSGSDDSAVTHLSAAAFGPVTIPLQTTLGAPITISGTIPPEAGPDPVLTITAQAVDNTGLASPSATLNIPLSDNTAPALAITAPAVNAPFSRGETVNVALDASDNFALARVDFTVTGVVTTSGTQVFTGEPKTASPTIPISIPADATEAGGTFTVSLTVRDTTGLTATSSRVFRLRDTQPPTLTSLTPVTTNPAPLFPLFSLNFSEALDPDVTGTVELLVNGTPAAFTRYLANGGSSLKLFASNAFQPGTTVVLNASGLQGADGNPIAAVNASYTVTDFAMTGPNPANSVIEGQRVNFTANGANNQGVTKLEISQGASLLASGPRPSFLAPVTIPDLADLGGTSPFAFSPVLQVVQAADYPAAPGNLTAYRGQNGLEIFLTVTGGGGNIWGTDIYTDDSSISTAAVHMGLLAPGETGFLKATILPGQGSYASTTRNGLTSNGYGGWPGSYTLAAAPTVSLALPDIALDVISRGLDSDGDGVPNDVEIAAGTDPFVDDRAFDTDSDGLNNAAEILAGTRADNPDTDGDGVLDGPEVLVYGSNPLVADTDGDGLSDSKEVALGTSLTLADTDGDGLSDAYEYGIGRYQVIEGSFNFDQAKADAVARGGHLATITSLAEQNTIVSLLPTVTTRFIWIGFTDRHIDGYFRWINGEPYQFNRWGNGQPDNAGSAEHYAHFWSGEYWNDIPFTYTMPYLLELGFATDPTKADTDGDGINDNVDTFLGGTIQVTVPLQNVSATFSAGGWPASSTIDGNTGGTSWNIHGNGPDNTTNQSFVVETVPGNRAADLPAGTALTFKLYFTAGYTDHQAGKFRLSYTTDDRDTFADGLQTGGDVTANWIVLTPLSASSTLGDRFTFNPDGSVLVSEGTSGQAVYTVTTTMPETGVTGFRFEVLEDPSLPTSGPGRASNGNLTMTEFVVTRAVTVNNLPPVAAADSFTTPRNEPFVITTAQLLANDFHPEYDPFVFNTLQTPANGTALLVGSNITYTPANNFVGADTFTYTLLDASGRTATGTVTVNVDGNARPVAGGSTLGSGYSLNFNGSQFATIAHQPAADLIESNQEVTIEAWVKIPSFPSGYFTLYDQYEADTDWGWIFSIQGNNSNGLQFYPSSNQVANSGVTPALNEWHHVAMAYKVSEGVIRFFQDGALVSTQPYGLALQNTDGEPAYLAFSPSGGDEFATGKMDDLRLWSRALTEAEIAANYRRQLVGNEPGLVGYWPFEEGVGNTSSNRSDVGFPTLFADGAAAPTWDADAAPLTSGPSIIATDRDTQRIFTLPGSDADGNPLTFRVLSLPTHGKLYQILADGSLGAEITTVPATVTDTLNRVGFLPATGYHGTDGFTIVASDGLLDSLPAALALDIRNTNTIPVATGTAPGNVLRFERGGSINFGTPAALQVTGDQTIEYWVRPLSYYARQNPYSKAYAGEGTMTLEPSGSMSYFFGTGGGNNSPYDSFGTTNGAVPLNQWTHIALVRDFTSNTQKFYINGVLNATKVTAYEPAVAGSNNFVIGAGYVSPFDGDIRDFRVWSVPRTEQQIREGLNLPVPPGTPGLNAWWKLTEGSGTSAMDSGPNALNSTHSGAMRWITDETLSDNPVTTNEDTPVTTTLATSDADAADTPVPYVIELPKHGTLAQTVDGTTPLPLPADFNVALSFPGGNPRVDLPSTLLDGLGDVTFEFWFAPSTTGRQQSIFSGSNTTTNNEFLVYFANDTQLYLYNEDAGILFTVPALQVGQWHHYAFVRDQTLGRIQLYRDGNLVGTNNRTLGTLEISPGQLVLGQNMEANGSYSTSQALIGRLDEIRLWRKALSPDEIRRRHNFALTGPAPAGLAARWSADSLSASQLDDSLGASPGTLNPATGGVTFVASETNLVAGYPLQVTDPAKRLIYTPAADFYGWDDFAFLANDGKDLSEPARISLLVIPVPDSPRALPDTVDTFAGVPTVVNPLANDYHPDGLAFSLVSTTAPTTGSLVTSPEGQLIYTAPEGFSGSVTFDYVITDNTNPDATGTVTLNVTTLPVVRWINPAGGNFNTAANWLPARVPTAADEALIDLDGTYTVATSTTWNVGKLTVAPASGLVTFRNPGHSGNAVYAARIGVNALYQHDGGYMQGPQWRIEGAWNWTNGYNHVSLLTVVPSAIVTISTSNDHDMPYGRMVNQGTVNWTGGRIRLGGASDPIYTYQILNIGTWNDSATSSINKDYGNTYGFFRNEGIYNLTGAGTTTFANGAYFYNAPAGVVNVGPDSVLYLAASYYSLENGSTINGPGLTRLNSAATWSGTVNLANARHEAGDISGTFTLIGNLEWANGRLYPAVFTVAAGSVLTITTANDHDMPSSKIINLGTVNWQGGRIRMGNTADPDYVYQIINRNVWNDTANSQINRDYGNTYGSFRNEGTYNRSGTTGSAQTHFSNNATFFNKGTLNLNEGSMRFDAQFVAEAGSTVTTATDTSFWVNSYLTWIDSATFTGPGLKTFSGGGNWNGDLTVTNAVYSGGDLAGTFTLHGDMNWTAGRFYPANMTLASDFILTISGTADHDMPSTLLINQGTVNWTAGRIRLGNTNYPQSYFRNEGTFNDTSGSAINRDYGASSGFYNAPTGLYVHSGVGVTTTFNNGCWFDNHGETRVLSGTLSLGADGASSGLWSVSPGAIVTFPGSYYLYDGVSFTGGGLARFPNGFRLSGTASLGTALLEGGAFSGEGTLAGNLTWSAGNFYGNNAQTITLATGSTMTVTGTGTHEMAYRRFINEGTFNLTEGTLRLGGGDATMGFVNKGLFRTSSSTAVNRDFGGSGTFRNEGTFEHAGSCAVSGNLPFVNAGQLIVTSGTLALNSGMDQSEALGKTTLSGGAMSSPATLTFGGLGLSGYGTVAANVVNASTIQVSSSLGALNVTGTFVQQPSATLRVVLGDLSVLPGYKALRVTGAMTLAGILDIGTVAPFAENAAASLPVIGYASRTGNFSLLTQPSSGYVFSGVSGATEFSLTVDTTGVTALPPANTLAATVTPDFSDFDHDGVSNFHEYLFGTDPARPDAHRLITPAMDSSGRFTFSFRRRSGDTSVAYLVETSSDLRTWQDSQNGQPVVEFISIEAPVDGYENVTVHESATLPASQHRHFRVRAILLP